MRGCRAFLPFRPTVHDLPPIKGQRCPSEPTSDHAIAVDETKDADGRRPFHNHVTTPPPSKPLPSQEDCCSQSSQAGDELVVLHAKRTRPAWIGSNPRFDVRHQWRGGQRLHRAFSKERCRLRTMACCNRLAFLKRLARSQKWTKRGEGEIPSSDWNQQSMDGIAFRRSLCSRRRHGTRTPSSTLARAVGSASSARCIRLRPFRVLLSLPSFSPNQDDVGGGSSHPTCPTSRCIRSWHEPSFPFGCNREVVASYLHRPSTPRREETPLATRVNSVRVHFFVVGISRLVSTVRELAVSSSTCASLACTRLGRDGREKQGSRAAHPRGACTDGRGRRRGGRLGRYGVRC